MNKLVPLVTTTWLFENKNHPNLIVLDATLKNTIKTTVAIENKVIPNALQFNWDKFSDLDHTLPHMLPSVRKFTQSAQELGINNNSMIVVYDQAGIYSSPRVWWMFLAMGFKNCFVLDGGMPAWLMNNYPCDVYYKKQLDVGNFTADYQNHLIIKQDDVLKALTEPDKYIIDARSANRFYGKVAEPRPGLRRGHMPNAVNIPFEELLFENRMRPIHELEIIFKKFEDKNNLLIFSCGSGITACIVALAATLIGYQNCSIYDGSWSEWGIESKYPVE